MGNGMNKVLPGLYVGNYRDSKDHQQLERHRISHIVAIHDSPRRLLPDKHYLCVMAADTPEQNLSQYFSLCNDFIHAARLRDGNVLIHCLAGMSRSVTVTVAYIMSVTNLNWKEALKVVRAGRAVANPNLGFQTQLQDFEMYKLADERRRLRERFPSLALAQIDKDKCVAALNSYEELLLNKDICEGNCSRGEKCPTGLCNMDSSKGIFRRRPSSSSTSSSSRNRLSPPNGAQSCPTSPKHGTRRKSNNQQIPEDQELQFSSNSGAGGSGSDPAGRGGSDRGGSDRGGGDSGGGYTGNSNNSYSGNSSNNSNNLIRSSSTLSHTRPRSSPAGLYSYTGSAPSSVHGSRQDLTTSSSANDKGSAIYLGFTPSSSRGGGGGAGSGGGGGGGVGIGIGGGGGGSYTLSGSSWSISSRVSSSSGSAPQTPTNTPPVSPRHGVRRSSSIVKKIR